LFGSGGGDARRGDGSAIAGTDDDEIVMLLSEFPIFGKRDLPPGKAELFVSVTKIHWPLMILGQAPVHS
jgi:hypothetical protein